MFIVLDIITVTILVTIIISGYINGVGKSILRLVAFIISIFGSFIFATVLAQPIYDKFISNTIIDNISNAILQSTSSLDLIDNTSEFLSGIILMTGSEEEIFSSMQQNLISIIQSTIAPAVVSFVRIVLFFIFLWLLPLLLAPIVKMLSKLFNLPIINILNKTLGALISIPIAFILIYILIGGMLSALPYFSEMEKYFEPEIINNTFIFKSFYSSDIVRFICNLLAHK